MDELILPSMNQCLICQCDYGTAGAEFQKKYLNVMDV